MDEDIVAQGRKSYWANKGKMDVPYDFGTPEYNDFERGWVSARRTHLVFQTEVLGSQRCGSNSPIRLLG